MINCFTMVVFKTFNLESINVWIFANNLKFMKTPRSLFKNLGLAQVYFKTNETQ